MENVLSNLNIAAHKEREIYRWRYRERQRQGGKGKGKEEKTQKGKRRKRVGVFPCCVLGVQPSVCALDKKTSMVRAILAWLALGNVEIMTDLMRGKKRAVLSGERKNCGGYFHAIYCSAYRGGGEAL